MAFRTLALSAAVMTTGLWAVPAFADRCDDLAVQLKDHVDGLSVGKTAANVIYLSHPASAQLRLGCFNREVTNELYAEADSRKPKPAFLALVASAAAIVFTIPRDDALKGATRCISRLGLLRGDDVTTRYRRLDMHCTRTKSTASITISRERE